MAIVFIVVGDCPPPFVQTERISFSDFDFACTNDFAYRRTESEAEAKWRQVVASRSAASSLGRKHVERIKPVVLFFRRFDWRSSPRWSARRWRSKT